MTSLLFSPDGCIATRTTTTPQQAKSLLVSSWQSLSEQCETRYFLSWPWLSSWLDSLPKESVLQLIIIKQPNQAVVGLGVFVEKNTRRLRFGNVRQWWLHRTGESALDQTWIEHNNFLLSPKWRKPAIRAFGELLKDTPDVDELIVHVLNEKDSQLWLSGLLGTSTHRLRLAEEEPGWSLQMSGQPAQDKTHFSRSLLRTLKQTKKHLNTLKITPVLEVIQDPSAQWATIQSAAKWHIEKWHDTSTPSGFTNAKFVTFHELLFKNHASQKGIAPLVFTLKDNGELLGILYGFRDGDWFGFYLSALSPSPDNKMRTGLILHERCIEWLSAQGVVEYDFMAGEARYKAQFATDKQTYAKLIVARKTPLLEMEFLLRRLNDFIRKKRQPWKNRTDSAHLKGKREG
jgi:hypothetical protein